MLMSHVIGVGHFCLVTVSKCNIRNEFDWIPFFFVSKVTQVMYFKVTVNLSRCLPENIASTIFFSMKPLKTLYHYKAITMMNPTPMAILISLV